MMTAKVRHFRADIEREHAKLDAIADKNCAGGQIIIDRYGAAWQHSRGYWYRAFDSDKPATSLDIATLGPFKTLTTQETL